MASFKINDTLVPVEAAHGIDLQRCIDSKLFKEWASSLDAELKVEAIRVQSVDYFGARVGFLKIETVTTFHGQRIPGICFLRGGAVSILVILQCEDEEWVVCTRQPRVPVGRADLLELPAGMLDGSGAFAGVAAKEMKEETGLDLTSADLIDLTGLALGDGVYPSPGGCDEFLRFMLHRRTVTRSELNAMRGKATGNLAEGEVIVLDLVEYKNMWRFCNDAKALSSMFLYERLRAAGMV